MGALGDDKSGSRSITMTLLVTLPTDSRVAPILPKLAEDQDKEEEEEGMKDEELGDQKRAFQSFDFEDYAWRVYHERLGGGFKDPLDRYRVT